MNVWGIEYIRQFAFIVFLLTLWLFNSCSDKSNHPEYRVLNAAIVTPPPNFHDYGSDDKIKVEVYNPTIHDLRIPKSHRLPARFRLIFAVDTFELYSTASEDSGFWTIYPNEKDTIALTTPVDFPQWPPEDTLDMNTILTNGTLEVCLPMDSANCHWTEVKKAESFYFRRGPAPRE